MRHLAMLLAATALLLTACKPKVPSRYLQPDEMEDLMYDYYVSQGLNDRVGGNSHDYQNRYNFEAVLRKYGITQAEFDSSLVYYYNNMERLNVIYANIQKRLSEEALKLGASEGEVERFTIQSVSGDTTDVWEGRRGLLLLPIPPYHVAQFSQKADTSFHQGDSFLLTFGNRFLVQGGSRNATAYLAVTYDNDSVVTMSTNLSVSGGTTLRINACDRRAKKIEGFVYLARRERSDNETDLCLLFLDHIQLMRFHHHKAEKQSATTADAAPEPVVVKADSTDSVKPRVHRLGERPLMRLKEDKKE